MMDLINSLFELFASLFILNHCRVLYEHKSVKGVSVVSVIFFTIWGLWNIIYYPSIGQILSFYAGIAVFVTNLIYISMLLYYRSRENV